MNTKEYLLGRIKAMQIIKSQCENEINQLENNLKRLDEELPHWTPTPWGILWL